MPSRLWAFAFVCLGVQLLQSVSNETLNELDIHNVDVLDSTATDLHQLARQLYRAGTQEQRFPDLPAGVAELVKSGVAELGWVWCTALKPLPWPSLVRSAQCDCVTPVV